MLDLSVRPLRGMRIYDLDMKLSIPLRQDIRIPHLVIRPSEWEQQYSIIALSEKKRCIMPLTQHGIRQWVIKHFAQVRVKTTMSLSDDKRSIISVHDKEMWLSDTMLSMGQQRQQQTMWLSDIWHEAVSLQDPIIS